MEASNSFSTGSLFGVSTSYGYFATDHGYIDAVGASSSMNGYGFYTQGGGYIDGHSSTGSGDVIYDYFANKAGIIDADANHGGTNGTGTNDGSYIYGF